MHFFDESFWLAISFIIFVYLAYKPVKNSILKSLDSKIDEIKMRVQEAENLKIEASALLEKTKNEIRNLDNLKIKILNEATEQAKIVADKRSEEINLLLDQRKIEALNSIEYQKTQSCLTISAEFAALTTKLAAEYFKESNNNNSSDTEIAQNFIKSK
jgi:F-type H+-transporting ATPase subunit b